MAKLSNKDIAEALNLTLKGKHGGELDQALKDAVNFLSRKRLISKSSYILDELTKIIDKEEGRVRAKVKSAKGVGDHAMHDLKKELTRRYNAKHVEVTEIEDVSLIGGMKIEVGDEVMDLTIKHKIGQLQEYLTNA